MTGTPTVLGAIRRRIMTPADFETSAEARGLHVKSPEAKDLLETIGRMFLRGFAFAAEAASPAGAADCLETVPVRFRGFAYEGAAMAFAMRDALTPGRPRHLPVWFAGCGDAHVYMSYVGVGWAMAKLPRVLWKRLTTPDPLLRWLVLDGYGFHQAYFHKDSYVDGHRVDPGFSWTPVGNSAYAGRVVDQGIGRALWFIGGADPDRVAELIDGFAAARHPDLYSGAGLAATYAGGATEAELRTLLERSGHHRFDLAQGSGFAAETRVRAGLAGPETELATGVFCGMAAQEIAKVTWDARNDLPEENGLPSYEIWRRRIAGKLSTHS